MADQDGLLAVGDKRRNKFDHLNKLEEELRETATEIEPFEQ